MYLAEIVCTVRYKCEFQELYEYHIDFRNWALDVHFREDYLVGLIKPGMERDLKADREAKQRDKEEATARNTIKDRAYVKFQVSQT